MTKNDLRTQIKHTLSESQYPAPENTKGFLASFKKMLRSSSPKTLFGFFSHGFEPQTREILVFGIEQRVKIALPRMNGNTLSFFFIDSVSGPFETGRFGIQEPFCENEKFAVKVEYPLVILVPGLAFTKEGDRLGHGKGYYDRFLNQFLSEQPEKREQIILAGVCHECSIQKTIPKEDHDVQVDCLITEKNYIICVKE